MPPLHHYLDRRLFRRLRLFLLWLGFFYAGWLVTLIITDHWHALREQWPIALAMAIGSYFAGSTPMGGGTVGFPVLVLLFGEPATIGRNFSLAVQSAGMVSAAVFILATRRPVAWRVLLWGAGSALITMPLAAAFVAPHVPQLLAKMSFAVIWASFGVMHLVRLREIVGLHSHGIHIPRLERETGLVVGFLGAVAASITGVGIDMIVYAVLVTLFRTDLKIAIPTSVILMAFTSVVGLCSFAALDAIEPQIFDLWLAAAPVVVLGAPLGALIVHFMPRKPTLVLVSALCIGQFIWTCVDQRVSGLVLAFSVAGVLLFNAVFHLLYQTGRRLGLEADAASVQAG